MIYAILEFIRKNPEESMQDEHLIDFYHRVIGTEEEEEDEEECDAHPPYRCDGGCGKKMGEGNDDECKRVCGDCEDEEEEEDKHECELCKKLVEETEYLPSKEDEEKQQILGNDYCLECYKKVEKFEFVENIEEE